MIQRRLGRGTQSGAQDRTGWRQRLRHRMRMPAREWDLRGLMILYLSRASPRLNIHCYVSGLGLCRGRVHQCACVCACVSFGLVCLCSCVPAFLPDNCPVGALSVPSVRPFVGLYLADRSKGKRELGGSKGKDGSIGSKVGGGEVRWGGKRVRNKVRLTGVADRVQSVVQGVVQGMVQGRGSVLVW